MVTGGVVGVGGGEVCVGGGALEEAQGKEQAWQPQGLAEVKEVG